MGRGKSVRIRHLMCGAASAVLLVAAGAAQAQEVRTFEIPAQPLVSALYKFGEQSGRQVLFKPALTDNKVSSGVSNTQDQALALAQLLEGTGLTFRKSGDVFLIEQAGASDPQSGSAAGDGAEGTVQALIVTAQKREEDIQDVPIAISAFTQEDLTRSQVAGGPDLMTQVPNFTFTKTNFSSYSIQIRGIGTQAISATTDPAVAVAFNNTPFIRNRFFEQEFYDLQRVEVLRGPQGTLYGRNATAGVVNIISQKPKFTYEARLSADLGNYNSQRFEGMVNVPLVDDKVALRLAGAWTKRDGYDLNQITGNRIDGRDLWSTRLSLRFAPTDKLDVNLIWEHFNEDDDRLRSGKQLCHRDARTEIGGLSYTYGSYGTGANGGLVNQGCLPASLYSPDSFEAPNGFSLPFYHPLGAIFMPAVANFDPYVSTTQSSDLRVIESTVDPHYRAQTDIGELQFSYDLGDHLTLNSETAWLSDELFSTQDYNRFNTAPGAFDQERYDNSQDSVRREGVLNDGVFCDPQIGCADRLVAVDLSTARSHQFSQEFRLASDYEGPFNFSLGANFLRYDTEDKYYVFINTLSMYAAISPYGGGSSLPPYVAGVSDNHECLPQGFREPDPNQLQGVSGCQYIDPNPIGALNDLGHNYFLSRNPYKLISYAVFGEAYYNITPALKLTAGLRWTVDKKEAPRIPSWITAGNTVGYPVAEVIEQEWREPTGRLTLDWKPDLSFTDETLLYGSFAHGYKAGGANPPAAGIVIWAGTDTGEGLLQQSATAPKTFEPEFVNAFEVGTKNTLAGGRLTLNADAFYYDYTGYQISYIVNRSAINLNFDAKVWGLEFEGDWRPLENLRLGLKLGYEDTRVADGSKAIDVMDRTAGRTDWIVVRPFPTFPSNCIVPLYTVHGRGDQIEFGPNSNVNGNVGFCEQAYVLGHDPVTWLDYVANPTDSEDSHNIDFYTPGYPGFDPLAGTPGHPYTGQNTFEGHDYGPAPNNGEGFYKDLSGNSLPNAPHITATITADYTIPLPNNWLATLHTDLYYQSEAWTRIFNTPGYDKLKAYTNVNFAAIFSNEDAGWKVMAYVKNVMDRDSITGAFLNSDDSGLTTNVFLTEPRLYGLRVTKEFTGEGWWTGANPNHPAGEPYPLTLELGGQVQRLDASYAPVAPSFANAFPAALSPIAPQNRDFDWGDDRQVKLIYRPAGSPWTMSAAVRYGRFNTGTARTHGEEPAGEPHCAAPTTGQFGYVGHMLCDPTYEKYPFPAGYFYQPTSIQTGINWADASASSREEHLISDFRVGHDIGIGAAPANRSSIGLGLRYADFKSATAMTSNGIPDWMLEDGFGKYPSTHHRFEAHLSADRKFTGAGPTLTWDSGWKLLGDDELGHVDLDWSVTGGVLFGRQTTDVTGAEQSGFFNAVYATPPQELPLDPPTPVNIHRSKSVSVPVVDLSLGLSYEVQRIKVGAGYRWERYYDVLDAGYAQHKSYDRTLDGPYFKIAVGFGG